MQSFYKFTNKGSFISQYKILGYCLLLTTTYILGKPRGLRTARKHVNHRREQRWADKDYKKAHLGTRWKANPFGGASHAKGIVLEKVYVRVTLVINKSNRPQNAI